MNEFPDAIEEMELIDSQLEGGEYTWARGRSTEAVSRIDRILYSTEIAGGGEFHQCEARNFTQSMLKSYTNCTNKWQLDSHKILF